MRTNLDVERAKERARHAKPDDGADLVEKVLELGRTTKHMSVEEDDKEPTDG